MNNLGQLSSNPITTRCNRVAARGNILKNMTYVWDPNRVTNPSKTWEIQVNQMGNYKVDVSNASGVRCPLSIDIFAEKCDPINNVFNCGTAGGNPDINGISNISNLAVGDEFTVRDYTVRVTIISGSQAAGWSGEGGLTFNFLKIGNNIALEVPITVTFDNIKVNQCYQLIDGKVKTKYDPSWGSVVSSDQIKNQLSGIYTEIKDLLANASENVALLQQKIKDLRAARADLVNAEFTLEYKTEQLAVLDAAITGMVCLVGEPPVTGGRLSVKLNTNNCDPTSVGESIDAAKVVGENSQINKWAGDVFDDNGNYLSGESRANGKFVIIKLPTLSYRLLNEYFVQPDNYGVINRIFLHYWTGLGFSSSSLKNGSFSVIKRPENADGDLSTSCKSNEIFVYVEKDNFVKGGMQNIPYLKTSLYHEKFHLVERLACPLDYSYKYYDEHIEVYYRQFSKSDFKTTMEKDWINGLYITLVNEFISPLSKTYPARAMYWRNKFKSLNLGI